MTAYTVLIGPIDHDGERHEEGAHLSMSAEEAELLVSQGIISEAEAPKRRRAEAEG
jgi:hypothetical protein